MSFHQFQHPPPKSWEEFEDLCLSLFGAVWQDETAQKNGRGGQVRPVRNAVPPMAGAGETPPAPYLAVVAPPGR